MIDRITDHSSRAKGLLTSMYRGRKNIEGMIKAFVGRDASTGGHALQGAENFLASFLARMETWQDTTVPADAFEALIQSYVLETIGRIVGISRDGRDVPHFIAAIQLRIQINRSDASSPTIYRILDLATADAGVAYEAADYYPANFYTLISTGAPYFRALADEVSTCKGLGVQANVEYTGLPMTSLLRFSSAHGATTKDKGYASAHGGTIVSVLPHVEVY